MKKDSKKRRSGDSCYTQSFQVPYEYPVHFTRDVFDKSNPALANVLKRSGEQGPHRMLAYVDAGLVSANRKVLPALQSYCTSHSDVCDLVKPPEMVPGGERTKNGWNVVQSIMSTIGQARLCRHSFVLVIGGGSVLDMVGFAASLVHRGIRLIRIPTTVLGQCDAGVGVKNGMDEHGKKNFVGTFAPPFAVLVDFNFLRTLEAKYWTGGIAEAFKVAMIKDARLFAYLCTHAAQLRRREEAAIEHVVKRTAILHLDHISKGGDPFELGAARPLDFGHWAAHKMEVLSNYRLGHGQAVSIGIALDSSYAASKGLLTTVQRDRVIKAMKDIGLPIWDKLLAETTVDGSSVILQGLEEFREHLGGQLTITLPNGIGRNVEVHEVDMAAMSTCMDFLKRSL
ncbi:MAG: 3-dehydroquinate synthase [bacterium]